MKGFPRAAMAELVLDERYRPASSGDYEVWNLNLDQVESDTGQVIHKLRMPVAELGPSTYAFAAGTVLYSKLRPYLNKVVVADEDGYATTELVPLRCRPDRVHTPYLAHYLRSPEFLKFANLVVAGTKMPRMVMSAFWRYEVPVPSLAEQRRIAAILDKAAALRAKRSEALTQLDRLAQAIFVEMFGDPVTGPKNCSRKKLADCVARLEYGPRFYDEAYSAEGVRIVRITDLDQGGALNFEAMPRMALDKWTIERFALQPGDIVFARTGATVGKVALLRDTDPVCIAGAYFIRLRFDDSVLPLYAASVLRAKSVQELIANQSRQAAQQNFSGPGLRALPMPVPPISAQQAYANRVEKILVERQRLNASLTEMGLLFSSLQHRAFQDAL